MKCNNCGMVWKEKLRMNKMGRYDTEHVRCPVCGSDDFTLIIRGR